MTHRNDHRILQTVCKWGPITWPGIRARLHRQYPGIHTHVDAVLGLVADGLLICDQPGHETARYSALPCPHCGLRNWSLDGPVHCLDCQHRPAPPKGDFPLVHPRFSKDGLPKCQACCGSAEQRGLVRFCRTEHMALVSDSSLCMPRVRAAFPADDPGNESG